MMPLLQKRKHVMMDFETQLSEMQILMGVVDRRGCRYCPALSNLSIEPLIWRRARRMQCA